MALWTIKKVADNPRKWDAKKGGKNVSYRIDIEAKDGAKQPPNDSATYNRVELVQRETTAAPTVGQELDGTVAVREYESQGEKKKDLKFTKAGQQGGGGGGRGWQPRLEDDPVVYAGKQAAIAAQTSLERATEVVVALGPDAVMPADGDPTPEGVAQVVIDVATKYEEHIQERAMAAGERVRNAGKGSGA